MKQKNLLILACLGILVLLPSVVSADCAGLGNFTSFSVTEGNTVTLYWFSKPFVRFDVQGAIEPTSKLQLVKSHLCDGDDVLVDGLKVTVFNVTSSLGSSTY